MSNPITSFLFTATGAFVIWLTKGFKGSFDNKMVSIHERHSARGVVRYFLGMGIWIVFAVVIYSILSRLSK